MWQEHGPTQRSLHYWSCKHTRWQRQTRQGSLSNKHKWLHKSLCWFWFMLHVGWLLWCEVLVQSYHGIFCRWIQLNIISGQNKDSKEIKTKAWWTCAHVLLKWFSRLWPPTWWPLTLVIWVYRWSMSPQIVDKLLAGERRVLEATRPPVRGVWTRVLQSRVCLRQLVVWFITVDKLH